MFNIEYDIDIDKNGRPFLVLSDEHDDNPEDKFFAIEVTYYIFYHLQNNVNYNISENTKNKLKECTEIIGQISDEFAKILIEKMKTSGDVSFLFNSKYHFTANSFQELESMKRYSYYFFNNKLFEIKKGLRVLILEEKSIFELDIDEDNNNHWKLISSYEGN